MYIYIYIAWRIEALKNKCTCSNRVCVLCTSETHVSQKSPAGNKKPRCILWWVVLPIVHRRSCHLPQQVVHPGFHSYCVDLRHSGGLLDPHVIWNPY